MTKSNDVPTKPDRIFVYVDHHQIEAYLLCGWVMRGLTNYGVLMEWLCECPLRQPKKERHITK